MSIAEQSIRRPVTVFIAVTACLLFGFLALGRIGLDLLPEINLPMIAVVTVYPNADPDTVEGTVTIPIERALRSVRNIRTVTSTSMENASLCLAEFNWGADLGAAQEEMRSGLDRVGYQLPEGVQEPIVSRIDPSEIPMLTMSIGAPGDVSDITSQAREIVKPAIERVEGVAGASITGGADRVITVEYDHSKLQRSGLSPILLQQLITFQNLSIPAGVVIDEGVRYQTRVGAKFTSADDVAGLAIGLRPRDESEGSAHGGLLGLSMLAQPFLTVADVATVRETFQRAEGYTRINGKSAIVLSVYKQSGENSVTVANRVKAAMAELIKKYPDIELSYIFDESQFITGSIRDLTNSAVQGAILAVIILYVFLRHATSTFIIGVSIPLSIIFTIVLMYVSKLTINLMTLGGLALGVGMLVDNSIVVLESIFRRQELGDPPMTAAVNGAKEVGMAIAASTMTTVAVFLPIAFLGSLAGEVFKDLAITVTFSLLASLVVAVTVVPLAAGLFVGISKDRITSMQGDVEKRRTLLGVYDKALSWSLAHRWIVLGIVGAAAVVSVWIYPRLGMEFLKKMDMGRVDVSVHMQAGTPVEVTNQAALAIEGELVKAPGIESVTAEVGSAGSGDFLAVASGASSNMISLGVKLRRDGRDQLSADEAGGRIREALESTAEHYPGMDYNVDTTGYGLLTGGMLDLFGSSVSLEIFGLDAARLNEYAEAIVDKLRAVPEFIEVSSTASELQPVMLLDVNPNRALLGSLTVGQIGVGVRTGMLGTTVTYLERNGELIPVIVKPASEGTPTLEGLMAMPVSASLSTSGIMSSASEMGSNASAAARTAASVGPSLLAPPTEVLVGRVATPKVVDGPMKISRRNGRRYVLLTVAFDGMSLSAAGKKALSVASEVDMPKGYDLELAGVNRIMADSFADLKLAAVIAVVLVYMVMAVQYESLFYPLIIMFTMPLAAIGAIGLLALAGETISLTAIIGLIVLAGIVVNNGIVMVDFINQLKTEGLGIRQAVVEASRARLRPILMTALTTILALVPLAAGWGSGTEMERPLALTVIGGLTTSTFLTLFVIPIIYELMEGFAQKLRRKGVR
ncbi:MAG: efflux RND transporter permease subunit [Clostridia bacterium]|nr:efflux RND transporter permease subunit [Clostridia bacterium]